MQQVVSNIDELQKELPVQVQKCLAFLPGVDRSVGGYEGLMAAQQALPNNCHSMDGASSRYSEIRLPLCRTDACLRTWADGTTVKPPRRNTPNAPFATRASVW